MDNKVEVFLNGIKDKKIAVFGVGTSNLPLIKLFNKYGATVYACDKKTKNELGENATLAEESGAILHLGENYLTNLDVDIVFRTPGMRFYMDELTDLRKKGVVVTSEMELFFDLCPCKKIAVTGSDGKTTTTSIIAKILETAGYNVHLGGNIGTPLLPKIEDIGQNDVAVVELSSFQLISMRESPDIAVVTNLTPNHLDMHKDMQEYIDAKKNIVLHQNAFSKAILNFDNEISNSFEDICRGEVLKFSRTTALNNGVCLEGENIVVNINGTKNNVIDISDIFIKGMHNVENYMAAIATVWGMVDLSIIKEVAKTFTGVEHRAEFVREVNGVKYYNDSIASSPTRTASGTLSLYDKKIVLIAGGYDKNIPYEDLGPIILEKVKLLILMGETAPKIENAVKNSNNFSSNNLKIITVQNMEEAVTVAFECTSQGDIVSMSPASASFDLYKNFDQRGKHFKELVNNL